MIGHRARHFTRTRDGRFEPRLDQEERELLATVAIQAQELITTDDADTRRLYPVAYPDDADAQAEFRTLMGDGLRDHHLHVLDTLASTSGAERLDEAELQQWMGAFEVLRLVLGTRLDVEEDMDHIDALDPRAGQFALYAYLSVLQGDIVEALATLLPAGSEEDE